MMQLLNQIVERANGAFQATVAEKRKKESKKA
jgi:hypothetical protein